MFAKKGGNKVSFIFSTRLGCVTLGKWRSNLVNYFVFAELTDKSGMRSSSYEQVMRSLTSSILISIKILRL